MKKAVFIGLSVAGTIIGAGFATGKEILMFFPESGIKGIILLIISLILMVIVSFMSCTQEKPSFLGKFFDAVFLVFIASSFSVMLSCGGETMWETINLPPFWGAVITYFLCLLITHFSLKGIYIFNSLVLPVMIFSILFITVSGLRKEVFLNTSPVMSSISYCGYNLLSLIPFLKKIKNKEKNSEFIKGTILGIFIVGVLGILIKLLLDKYSFLSYGEIPMLNISFYSGKTYGYFYSILVYLSVLTTAVSCLFSISSNKNRYLVSLPLLFLSFMGFESLISNIYTLFGYIGTFFIIYIILTEFTKTRKGIKNGRRFENHSEYHFGKS